LDRIITTCALDCPDNCGMIAKVRDGRLLSLEANPDQPYTRGFLCKKGYRYPRRVYSPNRIDQPLKRTDSGWKRITWEEALDTIAEKIRYLSATYGSGSIMHYQRSSSWGATKQLVRRFFNLLGGVTTHNGSLCAGSVMAAQGADMGARLGNDPEDLLNSRNILIWGRDPFKSTVHLIPILKEARKRGARIVLIDPIRTDTASIADDHIAPRPGTDGFMAVGMANHILDTHLHDERFIERYTQGFEGYLSMIKGFSSDHIAEKCDVERSRIEALARTYAGKKPSAILLGWGINKWEHSPEMIRLIDALGALTGNIGATGGGVNHGFLTKRHFDPSVMATSAASFKREIPEPLLGQGILDSENPPIKMIWINGTNPAVSCPNSRKVSRALQSLDFVVVVDHFMTDTANLAHLFLPTTTFLEEEDIVVSWGHNWIGPVNKAIEPLGESRSDLRIVQELAVKVGLGHDMEGTPGEWLKRIFQPMEKAGLSVEEVMQSPRRCPVAPMVAFEDKKFKTASGKFEFMTSFYEERQSDFPYHLISCLAKEWLNSLILEEEHPVIPVVFVHPETAKKSGVQHKSKALLKSQVGELTVEARITEKTREDTLLIHHGTWIKKGGGVNQLTEDVISTSGKMAAYFSTKASLLPLEP
jgi:anaerobic selenocysteine-containing dehydrogenase